MTAHTIANRETVQTIRESLAACRPSDLNLHTQLLDAMKSASNFASQDDWESVELWTRLAADVAAMLRTSGTPEIRSAERKMMTRVAVAMVRTGGACVVNAEKRRSDRLYDINFVGRRIVEEQSYSFSGWLPLAFVRECVLWTSKEVARMTDYPTMAMEGDWSGVRDSRREVIWEIFEKALRGELPMYERRTR